MNLSVKIRAAYLFLLLFAISSFTFADVFINEIHYDNDGIDADEGVEVAGPSGTDLTGWTIELYNGNGGVLYGTINLEGTIDNESNGFGAVWFAYSGIQNGAPDGLALVDPTGSVIQFLSYEGTITAVDGSASGMLSTDIGVSEPSTSTIGESLQLTGTGSTYADFAWTGPTTHSRGNINSGQTFIVVLTTTVSFSSSSASITEDGGSYDITVSITNPDASNATTTEVALITGDATDINNYTTQTVTFPAGSSNDQTVTVNITDDSDIEGDETLTFELQNVSGGNSAATANPYQFSLTIEDNDFASTPDIVINEIMQNPAAVDDNYGEWFELYNNTDSDIDINGWTVKDDDGESFVIDNGGSLIITSGGYLVFGKNDTLAVNGGVSVDYVYPYNFYLSNSSDEIVLVYSDGVSEVDRVNYDGGTNFPDPTGASMELNSYENDNNVGSNWAAATTAYGDGDLGTPGAQNSNFVSAIETEFARVAQDFKLYSNYPNPFNPTTNIRYELAKTSNIELAVYDITGKLVETLAQGKKNAGSYSVVFNAATLSSGAYFYQLRANGITLTNKMLLLK